MTPACAVDRLQESNPKLGDWNIFQWQEACLRFASEGGTVFIILEMNSCAICSEGRHFLCLPKLLAVQVSSKGWFKTKVSAETQKTSGEFVFQHGPDNKLSSHLIGFLHSSLLHPPGIVLPFSPPSFLYGTFSLSPPIICTI